MITVISYGDSKFTQSLALNMWTAKNIGKADKILAFGPNDIDDVFKQNNQDIFRVQKGAGYWIWKPYIIHKVLSEAEIDDYIVYSDCGTFYMTSIEKYINIMEREKKSIYVGEVNFLEGHYSKRDAFVYIGIDDSRCQLTKQLDASFLIIKCMKETRAIVSEWLSNCCDRRIISDDENVCGLSNYNGFVENRYDQTVMSLTFKKHGVLASKNISQPDPIFTCVEIGILLNKGKYRMFFSENKDVLKEKWSEKNYKYVPPLIVRTRFRNMNVLLFVYKIIGKVIRYWYRNKLSYLMTKLYVTIKG